MRSRLLMGTAAWKHKVDMYLYYELGSWSPFFSVGGYRPMGQPDGVTPTLEVLDMRYASASYDGEAMLILPGPEGMLSTLHFDSLRDGKRIEPPATFRRPFRRPS